MYKVMCLDVGTKRIGVALSDYLQMFASGHCCVSRKPEKSAIEELIKIVKENSVKKIVIGVPINMDGTEGEQAIDCRTFGNLIQKSVPDCDIIFEDERLTSDFAEERLREKKVDYRKNKALVDIESACIILEQYLRKV